MNNTLTKITGEWKKHKVFIICILIAILTFCINRFPLLIEQYYSTGLYLHISRILRFLLGWIPFSIGDVLYGILILTACYKLVAVIRKRKHWNKTVWMVYTRKLLLICTIVYIFFNWLWGFNYNRLGSAWQLRLEVAQYSKEELLQLVDTLAGRLYILSLDNNINENFNTTEQLADESMKAYKNAAMTFPFLHYTYTSLKPEILHEGGNYMGFLGYFNPFTSEAQLNTTIPSLLQPYVVCHEMAHQLGYASESEANFVGYLACKQSVKSAFRYSVYFDLFSYAINDLYRRDTMMARTKTEVLPKKIKDDLKQVSIFFSGYKNPFTPVINWIYDKYLKLNNQPKGKESYNEVVGWMIAYAKQYGWEDV